MSRPTLTRRALPEILPEWGIAVLESHHAPDFVMDWRKHRFIKIIYALKGAGELYIENKSYKFRKKDLLVIPAGQRNRIVDSYNQPTSLYVLCLAPRLLAFDPKIEQHLTMCRMKRSEHLAYRAESLLKRLLFHQSNGGKEASLAMAASALSLLHIVIGRSAPNQHKRTQVSATVDMSQYLEYLDSHFFEAEDINAAARKLGISRRTFTKLFREITGASWLEYVRGKAIDHATHLLTETPASIASIAFECGFTDLSTFYRHFKARTGYSPAIWREKSAQES